MSDPSSLDHSIRSSSLAGQPKSWLAANKVVAALLLPPPRPAWTGMRFSR